MGILDRFRTNNPRPAQLTAAAAPIDIAATLATPGKTKPGSSQKWQEEAWDRFDDVGELSSVCSWFSNSLSRVRLIASDINEEGQPTERTSDKLAAQMVQDIAGGPAGQASMLSRLATFLTVPGESWVAITVTDDGEEWFVLGDTEIVNSGPSIQIVLPDETRHELNPDTDSLFRIWRPHPRKTADADSPVRAALPILREIRRCDQKIDAAGKSRIAGNGVLAIPNEVSMPSGLAPTGDSDAPGLPSEFDDDDFSPSTSKVDANQFMQALQNAMTTSISDQASAAAMVPIVLQAPGEWVDKIKHLTLNSDVIETDLTTRERAIRRLALSMDVPPEVLLGNAESNHWSAWASRDDAISTHISPMMTLICDALTTAVLRPLLEAHGHPDPESVVVWFDVSNLSRQPDRRAEAAEAFDRGVISAAAYRQELGYTDEDAPEVVNDPKREMAVQMAINAPSLFTVLWPILGFTEDEIDLSSLGVSTRSQSRSQPAVEDVPESKQQSKPQRRSAIPDSERRAMRGKPERESRTA